MPRDIEPERCDLPFEVIREMSPDERMRITFELTNRMRRKIWERIQEQHPEWPNWEQKIEFMRWIFDPEPLPHGFEEFMRELRDEKPPSF